MDNIRERNYKQVMLLRHQNQREERLLEHSLYSRNGVLAIHKYHMHQVEHEENSIRRELQKLRGTTTSTWGFLPPRYRQAHSGTEGITDPFEKVLMAQKLLEFGEHGKKGGKRSKGGSPSNVKVTGSLEDIGAGFPIETKPPGSSPGKLENIGSLDVAKVRQNIFTRLAQPKKHLEPNEARKPSTGLHDAVLNRKLSSDDAIETRKPPPGAKKSPLGTQNVSEAWMPTQVDGETRKPPPQGYDVIEGGKPPPHPNSRPQQQSTNSHYTENNKLKETVGGHVIREKVVVHNSGLAATLHLDKPTNVVYKIMHKHGETETSVHKDHTGQSSDEVGVEENIQEVSEKGQSVPENNKKTNAVNFAQNVQVSSRGKEKSSIQKGPVALAPIKEITQESMKGKSFNKQHSFARSLTKGSSFISSKGGVKTRKRSKVEEENTVKYNHDGSLRTVFTLPDFETSAKEAINTRYLRMRDKVWYEREMSVSDVWKDRDKPLSQKLKLS